MISMLVLSLVAPANAGELAPLKQGCDVLTNEIPEKTMARGAFLHVTSANGETYGAGQDQRQVCVGTVTLAANESRTFLLTPSQCTGFDYELRVVH